MEATHGHVYPTRPQGEVVRREPTRLAFSILQLAFVFAPIVAGLDKLTHILTNWDRYLSPALIALLPVDGHTFMLVAGVIEIGTGLLVAVRPRIGGYVLSAWLIGIIVNLLIHPMGYFDIALRDLGLAMGALAMAKLAKGLDRK